MNLPPAFYVETSAALRAIVERGFSLQLESSLDSAEVLITSRLSLVEATRSFTRMRLKGTLSALALTDAERDVEELWERCEVWDISHRVCDLASVVAPRSPLRSLDAIHLATFLLARKTHRGLGLLTADRRLQTAAESI